MLAKIQMELSLVHAEALEERRKIPSEIAAAMGVVSSGKNIAFEYRDQNGTLRFRKFRSPDKRFWIEPKGTELLLWNEQSLSVDSDTLVITEGEFDALSWAAAGVPCVVSVPNGASLSEPGKDDIEPDKDTAFRYLWDGSRLKPSIDKFKRIILSTDDDQKGHVLRGELAVRLGRQRCWWVQYPKDCKDANDALVKYGVDALLDVFNAARPIVPNRLVRFSDIPNSGDAPVYGSGWRCLDDHLRIIMPELIVITGSAGAGKSQWTLNLCANLARRHGLKGAILQLEDDPERNRTDLLLYAESWKGKEHGIGSNPIEWVDRMFRTMAPIETASFEDDYTMDGIRAAIEEAALRHDCKWVVIDPWNEIEHIWRVNETETAYTNGALRDLKRLSRMLQIALIIVAHPTKGGAMSKGIDELTLYDVAGSSAWKNKADHGIIVYREDETSDTIVKVDKSKDWRRRGFPGKVTLAFNSATAQFQEA